MSIYDFTVQTQDGKAVSLSGYKGKVLLIVNTATGCGFTPQYDELQNLYEFHQKDGLEILDFPCNQFAEQAPGSDEEIHSFCTGRYGITFPQTGVLCGRRPTSCADQLAKAVRAAYEAEKEAC